MYQQRGIAEKTLWEEVKEACDQIYDLENKNSQLERCVAEYHKILAQRRDMIVSQIKRIRNREERIFYLEEELTAKERDLAALQAELEKTKAELEQARNSAELNPKCKNTYLKIIAALAQKNRRLDLHERGAAGAITRAVNEIGFSVSDDTARKIIKEIDELQK